VIQGVNAYLARPVATALPLLVDDADHALGVIQTSPVGCERLSLLFDGSTDFLHGLILAADLVRWVSRGVFVGERRLFLSAQVDDLLIEDAIWEATTPCGTNPHDTGSSYRMTDADLRSLCEWQRYRRSRSAASSLTLDLAFNGVGASGLYEPDSLTPEVMRLESEFRWISHTYQHLNHDTIDYDKARDEIEMNAVAASALGLSRFSPDCLVTPDVSGLKNPELLRAARDAGIRYLAADASAPWRAPTVSDSGDADEGGPFPMLVPRRPTNLYYNVSTPEQWVAEYNCHYRAYWKRDLTYEEILNSESTAMLAHLLQGHAEPWMFHEANLRAYDGTHSLLSDLLDRVLDRYEQIMTVPIRCLSMKALGEIKSSQPTLDIHASLTAEALTIGADQPVVVPVTGVGLSGLTRVPVSTGAPAVVRRRFGERFGEPA
jgi:hypothetical protein